MKKTLSKFFSKYDILSEEVKVNSIFTNDSRPKKAFGGILSIISFSLSLAMALFLLSGLFIRASPKAYEVTRFIDDTPKIFFDNKNNFFVIRFYSPQTNLINESLINFYGKMATVKSETTLREYGFDPCVYDKDFEGVKNFFPPEQKEDLEANYYCLSKMFLNGS